jgi:outer membrane protein assembly factor BamB
MAMGLVAWASFVSPARADDWTSLGLDASRTRATTERSGDAFRSAEWRYTLPAVAEAIERVLVSSPAVADGVVVFGTTTGEVVALGATDGRVRWQFRARDGIHASPAIVRGKVIVPSFDGNLYALRLADGATLWTRNLGSVAFSSPAPVEDTVVVSTGFPGQRLVRVDAATGAVLWETPAGTMDQGSNSSVAIAGDQVLVGAMAGTYYSFDLATGALRWKYTAGGAVHMTTPLVVGGKAFFAPGGSSHAVHAVDLQTGQAVSGWPLQIPDLPVDSAVGTGTVKDRDYATSSIAQAGDVLLFQQRMLEFVDTDRNGLVETFIMREETIAVDPGSAGVAWRVSAGRVVTQDRSAIPAFGVCPTPLVYADARGQLLAAAASTLSEEVRVLQASSGAQLWSKALSAPTRSSPVLANGRLVVATNAGIVHSLLSSSNQPPFSTMRASIQPLDVPSVGAVVSWAAAIDPEGDTPRYHLRLDSDGEILTSWEHEVMLTAGETSLRLSFPLRGGASYTYAVRARDSKGAWSDWTAPQTLRVVESPAVSVGGVKAASLAEALAAARAGDVVQLGAGTFRLTESLRVPAGVTVAGAGARQTILDGTGLGESVSVRGSRSDKPSGLDHLTVKGGRVGVSVVDSQDATIRNVVVRDATDAGVQVESDASARVVNVTVVRSGVAIQVMGGAATVRNSLIVGNRSGLVATAPNLLVSDFNDVQGSTPNYANVVAGAGDLEQAVAFVDAAHDDFRLKPNQPSTDAGDPAAEWTLEPAPNGGRINLGAFGNTADAETSGVPVTIPPPVPPGEGAPSVPVVGTPKSPALTGGRAQTPRPSFKPVLPGPDQRGGCQVAATPVAANLAAAVVMALLMVVALSRRVKSARSSVPARRRHR